MIDYFQVLDVDVSSADVKACKRAYQALALKHHPDKKNQNGEGNGCKGEEEKNERNREGEGEEFLRIQEAWEVLQDPERLAAHRQEVLNFRQKASQPPMNGYIDVDEMTIEACIDDEMDGQEEEYLVYPCRCGGEYAALKEEIVPEGGIIQCSLCSLNIGVNRCP
eukprot:Nk52_evm16s628 gene=Nk52_evmTU16s628